MIASHYAEPLPRVVAQATALRSGPAGDAAVIVELNAGEVFDMLEDSVGWAWGYAGEDRRVGYVESSAVARG